MSLSYYLPQCLSFTISGILSFTYNKCSAIAGMGDRLATIDMAKKREAAVPPFLGTPTNTMWPGPWSTSVPSCIFIYPAIWPQQTWAENWGGCAPLKRGSGSPSNTMWPGLRPTSIPRSILIHSAVWPQYIRQKVGGCCTPFFGGELGPHLTQINNVAWAKAYLRTKWHLDPSSRLATTDKGRKLGVVPLLGEGSWNPI